jgi:hypothetical protein
MFLRTKIKATNHSKQKVAKVALSTLLFMQHSNDRDFTLSFISSIKFDKETVMTIIVIQ